MVPKSKIVVNESYVKVMIIIIIIIKYVFFFFSAYRFPSDKRLTTTSDSLMIYT